MDELRALSGTDFGTLRGTSSNSRTSYPSNIDGIDERNGHFLFYEIKQLNEQTSEGQQRMLEALAKMPKTTVLIVRCNGERTAIGATRFNPVSYERIYAGGMTSMPVKVTLQSFAKLRDDWFRAATNDNANAMRYCFDTVEGEWLREQQEIINEAH